MRWGMLARGEDRGLGILTWEAHRNLRPDRTLLVKMGGDMGHGYPVHHDRFPDATPVTFEPGDVFGDVDLVRDWLVGLDVVYTAETPYDWRLVEWCRDAGAALVVHTMPELHRLVAHRGGAEPTVWWNPTDWMMDDLRQPTWTTAPVIEVPVPVALDRFAPAPIVDGRPRFLHIAGKPAAGDRNGTSVVGRALRRVRPGQRWIIRQQYGDPSRLPGNVTADVTIDGPAVDYWRLYDGADVLVMPRRYGGLCLPVQEAMAAGLAVVMPDCSPNRRWPIVPFRADRGRPMNDRGVPIVTPNFVDLAAVADRLDDDPAEAATAQRAACRWAVEHSWDALTPVWMEALDDAARRNR